MAFAQEAFNKRFDLGQKKVDEKFSELNFSFLLEDSSDDEVEPFTIGADLPHAELAYYC